MSKPIKIIYGAAAIADRSAEETQNFYDTLIKHNVHDLDTASLYPGSEKALGETGAPSKFIIHTKAPGFTPGSLSRESILSGADKSLEELKTKSVDTYFFHSPDTETAIEESVDAVQEVFKVGKFKRFGLSNFTPEDVRRIYDYAASKDYVLPSVYQGNYNPVARRYDESLFPLLRELKISFYAYSPLAGGFLTKTPEVFKENKGTGRWDITSRYGKLYHSKYNRPTLVESLSEWNLIAKDAGITPSALAYRWVTYNSILSPEHGDGIIIGASSVQQLEDTLKALEDGPLDPKSSERIDKVWASVKDEAPIDNYHD